MNLMKGGGRARDLRRMPDMAGGRGGEYHKLRGDGALQASSPKHSQAMSQPRQGKQPVTYPPAKRSIKLSPEKCRR